MSLTPEVRKFVAHVESVHHDGGPRSDPPLRKGVCAAVIANPYAGRYETDLMAWMESLRPLAVDLTEQLLEALRVGPESIQAFGKGALVGVDGEHEHAAAWHAPGGHGLKSVLKVRGFVTAGQAMGAVGAPLHIPLVYVNSPWVRSHFDAIDLTIADAPRPREIVFALAVSTGGRVHSRLGGLTAQQAEAGEGPKF
ncbi:MAG TPA: amino acid synthesis family protein [Steroidobacteraceae bacterium]|nr:amino acid synthesis family protein [Steroidobacteraceae bacterium]